MYFSFTTLASIALTASLGLISLIRGRAACGMCLGGDTPWPMAVAGEPLEVAGCESGMATVLRPYRNIVTVLCVHNRAYGGLLARNGLTD